jgi:hypothetical protein
MLRNLLNKKKKINRQDNFIQSLEGIGDILVYETRRQKNKLVLNGLERITDTVMRIFEIQRENPHKFDRLIASKDYIDLYERDEKKAKSLLTFNPEKYLVGFSAPINQIVRVYESAINSQNQEISEFAVYYIIWILDELSSSENNTLFVEQILRKLYEISRTSVQRKDNSAYAAAIHWYTDIVFNRLGRKAAFQTSYLALFDKYLFFIVQYIVSQEQTTIFYSLVSSLVDGIHIPDYHRGKVWDYGHLVLFKNIERHKELDAKYGLDKKIQELADSENDLNTQEKLGVWFNKFEELKTIIDPNLDDEQKSSAQEIEENIREFVTSQFKYQNLLEVVFAIGAYCLFKNRYDYIKYLWEYKQPPDSVATWVGHDITPNTLDDVIRFYFRENNLKRKFDFWEGHHGNDRYYKQYFLLLLARILQGVYVDSDGKYSQIENYKLPSLPNYRLSDLSHSIEGFIELANELKQAGNMLEEIGLDALKLDNLFDDKLIPLLNKLKEEAEKQISARHKSTNISSKRVKEFKKEVIKAFYEVATIRNIFTNYLNAYEDKTKEHTNEKRRFTINIVDDKAAFFEEWHVHYVNWGENYGRDFASSEDTDLFNKIAKDCIDTIEEGFETTLVKIKNPDDIIILSTKMAFWRFFEDSKNFRPKWYRDIKQLDVKGFDGWYDLNGKLIPIFNIYHRMIDNQILVLNKSKVGRLVQLSPLNHGESKESVEDIFYIDIQAYSENDKLMEEIIKEPPEWLKKIGNEKKQREHLKERVRIQIFERFEFRKHENFEGYRLVFKKD